MNCSEASYSQDNLIDTSGKCFICLFKNLPINSPESATTILKLESVAGLLDINIKEIVNNAEQNFISTMGQESLAQLTVNLCTACFTSFDELSTAVEDCSELESNTRALINADHSARKARIFQDISEVCSILVDKQKNVDRIREGLFNKVLHSLKNKEVLGEFKKPLSFQSYCVHRLVLKLRDEFGRLCEKELIANAATPAPPPTPFLDRDGESHSFAETTELEDNLTSNRIVDKDI